jgi:drug/metabolite transporter (DMT)-like permease
LSQHTIEQGAVTDTSRTRLRAEFFLLVMTLIWGTTFVIVKLAVSEVSPMFYLGLRFGLATLFFALVFFRKIFPLNLPLFKASLGVMTWYFLGFLFQTIGMSDTTASKSGLITGVYVVLTPIFQSVIEKRPPPLGIWVAVAMVFGGLFLLTSGESLTLTAFTFGDALTLCCAASYALYIVYLDKLTTRPEFADDKNFTFKFSFMQTLFVTVLSFISAFSFETIKFAPSVNFYLLWIYIALFATVFATLLQTRYQKDTTPSRAAIIFIMESVIAVVLGYFFLNETLSKTALIGAALMVGGLIVSERS